MKSFAKIRPLIAEKLKTQDQEAERIRKTYFELKLDVAGTFLVVTFLWWAFYYLGKFPLWTLGLPLLFGPLISFLRYKSSMYVPLKQTKIIKQSKLNKILVNWKLAKQKPEVTIEYIPSSWQAYLAALGLSKKFKMADFESIIKKAIVQKFLESLSDSITYEPTAFVNYKDFEESKIFIDLPAHYSGDDLIEGKIDNIPLKISELVVKSEDVTQNKWKDMFTGIFMVASYPKPFKTSLVIIANDLQEKFGYAARAASEINPMRMSFIASSDANFNKFFSCYAQDKLLGEELLESLVGTLMKFYKKTKLRCSISLIGDKIYAAVNYQKPLFVFDFKQPIWSYRNIQIAYRDFSGIYFLVETLDIDRLVLPIQAPVVEEVEEEEEEETQPQHQPKAPSVWMFWKWSIWIKIGDFVQNFFQKVKESSKKQPPSNRWEYLKKLESRRDTDGDGKTGWR
jgi:hypothetical protein